MFNWDGSFFFRFFNTFLQTLFFVYLIKLYCLLQHFYQHFTVLKQPHHFSEFAHNNFSLAFMRLSKRLCHYEMPQMPLWKMQGSRKTHPCKWFFTKFTHLLYCLVRYFGNFVARHLWHLTNIFIRIMYSEFFKTFTDNVVFTHDNSNAWATRAV